jgi:hypothetical protein
VADDLAAALASDAPAVESPSAAPAAPASPATEPSRRETIREAVAEQKERVAAPDGERPAKAPASAADRARDPTGKFAPAADRPAPDRTAAPAATAPAPAGDASAAVADPAKTADETPRPPPGWSPASKVAFDALPDHIKADIAKREREVNTGLAKLAEFKPVEKFAEMARRGGTTLDRALENYVGIEQLLGRDPIAAFEQIMRNVRINPQAFATAYLNRQGGAQAPHADPAARQPAALDPQAIVRQATEAVRAEYEAREVQSEVQRFENDPKNRFYPNVKQNMAQLVHAGLANTIQDAYDMACRMDPEISRLINAPPAPDPRKLAADQARAAARATIGSPSPGMGSARSAIPPNATRREAIAAIVAQQKGGRA